MTTTVAIDHRFDHSHDSFTITRSRDTHKVVIQLWSRGSFTVEIVLSVEDGRAFAAALLKETSG